MNIRAIIGPMFAGKTTFILTTINRFLKNNKKIAVYTSTVNTRSNYIESHTGEKYDCIKISTDDFMKLTFDYDAVFVDEIQFFEPKIIDFIAKQKCLFFISGLDKDFRSICFPTYIAILNRVPSENIHYLKSICSCGNFATLNKLKINNTDKNNIIIGGDDLYEVCCMKCF